MQAGLILARLDSSRLPGKALLELGEKKLVEWAIDGVKNLSDFEPILVTTDRKVDLPLVEIAKKNNIHYFCGDFENVAKRVFDCIAHFDVSIFARINGDSPFVIKDLYDVGLKILQENDEIDFVTNLLPRHFPYGISIELFRSVFFKEFYKKLNTKELQEHITSWIYQNQSSRIFGIKNESIDAHGVRAVIDTEEDYKRIFEIIKLNSTFDFYNCQIEDLIKILQ